MKFTHRTRRGLSAQSVVDNVYTKSKVDDLLSTHSSLDTDVHGITSPDTVESSDGAQAKVDAAKARAFSAAGGAARIPVDIPTYDNNLDITHPDVLFIPEGWNGYRYWMAFTPFPDSTRENPSIVASNDGVNWVVPDGLINPVVAYSDGPGGAWSDPDLILRPDNKLMMYFRKVNNDNIFAITSSDGVNWDVENNFNPILTPGDDPAVEKIVSPAVVVEEDDTFTMFSVDNDSTPTLHKRTSADGLSWSTIDVCTLPSGFPAPFHLDVQVLGGKYHALIDCARELYYLKSDDGITWEGSIYPALDHIRFPGDTTTVNPHYRSTFVPIPGNPERWRVWVATFNSWRVLFCDDITLRYSTERVLPYIDSIKQQVERIFIPPGNFMEYGGTPALGLINTVYPAWTMPDGANQQIITSFMVPKHWRSIRAFLVWTNLSTNSGNIRMTSYPNNPTIGYGDDLTGVTSPNVTLGALGQYKLNISQIFNSLINDAQIYSYASLRLVLRRGDELDTLTGDVAILGVVLTPSAVELDGRSSTIPDISEEWLV